MSIKWTKKELDKLVRLYGEGLTYAEISRRFGGKRSPEAIRRKKQRLGLKPRTHKDIVDISGDECRWPIARNQHGVWIFCGKPTLRQEVSYCETHYLQSLPLWKRKEYHDKQNE